MLQEKYLLPFEESNKLSSFLLPMLRLHPDRRASAKELLAHSWLDGVIVQGEIEAMERQRRLQAAAAGGSGADAVMGDGRAAAGAGAGGVVAILTSEYKSYLHNTNKSLFHKEYFF